MQDRISDIAYNYEWAGDSKTVFYTKQDLETMRWESVYRYEMGSNSHNLVYEEKDNTFNVSVSKSLSERFLYITTESTDQSEEYFIDANTPSKNPTLFFPRKANHEYTITDGENHFYIVTNDNAINFKLMETPIDRISKENWRRGVPHRDDVLL